MSKLLKSIGIAVVAVAFVFSVAAVPTAVPTADAITQAQANAIIAALGLTGAQADLINALVTQSSTPVSSCANMNRDLTIGAQGSDVADLQAFLVASGNLVMPAGVSMGYFGSLTQSALASYQAANGISPAVGYFGPITRANVAAKCAAQTPAPSPSPAPSPAPGLSGEGDIEIDVALDSDIIIDLGDTEEVIELELEAVDGDVKVDRIDFVFDARPWLYFDQVYLLVDGKKVASLSGSGDFSETSGSYRARFSGLNLVISEDDTVAVTLVVKVLSSMSGDREDETVNVIVEDDSIRFMDAAGATLFTGEDVSVDIEFSDTFGEGDLEVTLGDDSPENETFILDEDSRTNGVTVLEFNVEATDGDIEIQDVTVEITSSDDDTAVLVYRAYLYRGNTLLKSTSVTGDEIVFEDIDYAIDEDDEETFTVKLDFNKTDGLTFDTIEVVEVTVDAENSDFEDVSDTLAVGETHNLVVEGLVDTFVSKSSSTSQLGDNTIATLTFVFDLTAFEDEFYIAEDGSDFTVTLSNVDTSIISTTIASTNATLMTADDSYRINKGQTRRFTVEVKVESDAGTESTRATIDSVDYNTDSDLGGVSATLDLGAPDYRSTSVTVFTQ